MAEARVIDRKVFYPGQAIFNEGDEGNRAFLVQEGIVEIYKNIPGEGEKVLGTVEKGGIFGEMALVDDQPRMASARAREQVTVILISRAHFQDKVKKADPFIRALLNIFVTNIRRMAKK